MEARLIHVMGASGSGTTTLGRALAARHGYLHLDTDDYYWLPTDPPFMKGRDPNARRVLLGDAMGNEEKVAITGSLVGWGEEFIPALSLVVVLEVPAAVRVKRIEAREIGRFGGRVLPGGDMHESHREFVAWAATYDTAGPETRSAARTRKWLEMVNCPVITLDGTRPVDESLAAIGTHF